MQVIQQNYQLYEVFMKSELFALTLLFFSSSPILARTDFFEVWSGHCENLRTGEKE